MPRTKTQIDEELSTLVVLQERAQRSFDAGDPASHLAFVADVHRSGLQARIKFDLSCLTALDWDLDPQLRRDVMDTIAHLRLN